MLNNFSEIVWVSRDSKQPAVADGLAVVRAAEHVLLRVAYRLHSEAHDKQDRACYISPCAKGNLVVARHGW